ncbi:MAG: molybdopterin-dependent oxidoreductase [Bacillota bacterium]|nr:molybdopterin-dependent oxidoreductase [Bacillota bacterium]
MKKLLLSALLLVALLFAACSARQPQMREETGQLAFTAEGASLGVVDYQQLVALDSYLRQVEIHSAGEGYSVHQYRGARLRDVIALLDASLLEQYAAVTAIGADDYLAAIGVDEVLMENNAFVMWEDNGEPILTKDGEPYGMRLVLLDDSYAMRYTKYLIEIQFLTAEQL